MRKEKEIVKDFYDTFGWKQNADGVYNDSVVWLDASPATSKYQHQCRVRNNSFLSPAGKHFLDAGSGAIAHPEYLDYSAKYERRVCVDLSITGLREARRKLGGRGLYVVADLTRLPFREGVFDGAICSHVLYHIPEDEQESVVTELHRVARAGSQFLILYMWPTCFLSTVSEKLNAAKQRVRATLRQIPGVVAMKRRFRPVEVEPAVSNAPTTDHPPLYCHAHEYQWFRRKFPTWNLDVRASRSIDESFMRYFVREDWTGQLLLKLIFWFETSCPHFLGKIGRYPAIIVRKA